MLDRPLKHYPRCSVPQVRRARSGRPHQRLDPRAPALLSACICNAVNWGAILEIAGAAFSRGRSCSSSSRRWASGSAGSRLSRATHPRTSRCATRSSMARLGRFSPSEKRQDPKRRTLSRVSTEPRPCEIRSDWGCPVSIWSDLPWGTVHHHFWSLLNGEDVRP